MGQMEVSQIKERITRQFAGLIDLTDAEQHSPEQKLNYSLTRSLAAYAV